MEFYQPAFEYQAEALEIDTWIGKLVLTHSDTRLRIFEDPRHKQFNHVEHIVSDADQINAGIERGKVYGFIPTQELGDWLNEHHFPLTRQPQVDQDTYQWFLDMQEQDFNQAPPELHIEDILGQQP